MTPEILDATNLPLRQGALILKVDPGAPVDAAGVKPGDVITALRGRPVASLRDLRHALSQRRIGEPVDVTIWRHGQALTVKAVIR